MTISNLATCLRPENPHSHGSLVDKVSTLIECLCHPDDGSGQRRTASVAAEDAFDASLEAETAIADLLSRVVELERLVVTDELTELLNRRGIENELKRALSSAGRHNEQGVLIYIDLDGFKPVNDTFGHAAGDAVLCRVARILSDSVRDTDYIGRIGGDEFVVLMTRTYWQDGLSRSEVISNRLNHAVLDWNDRQIAIKASIGMQNYGSGDTGHDLLKRADEAMYKTKQLRSDLLHGDGGDRQKDPADTRRVANL